MTTLQEWAIKTALVLLALFSPVKSIMIATGILVTLDFITGILASRKRKEPITSHRMKRTVVKGLAYQAAIIFSFLIEKYFIPEVPTIKVVTSLIAITEAKSFFENINVITGVDFLKEVLNKLQGKEQDKTNKSE